MTNQEFSSLIATDYFEKFWKIESANCKKLNDKSDLQSAVELGFFQGYADRKKEEAKWKSEIWEFMIVNGRLPVFTLDEAKAMNLVSIVEHGFLPGFTLTNKKY